MPIDRDDLEEESLQYLALVIKMFSKVSLLGQVIEG